MSEKGSGVGAPPGNQNAYRGRIWRDALNRALEKRGCGDRIAALDALAEKFLDTVEEMTKATDKRGASVTGFTELADRLDGRPTQALEHSGPDGEKLPSLLQIVGVVKPTEGT